MDNMVVKNKVVPKPKMYMNTNTRAVYFAKPQHANNPVMVPYFGELPPLDPKMGLCIVPREELGPEFALEEGEEVTEYKEIVPNLEEEEEGDPEDKIAKMAAAINDLKAFDFTSAGIPKVDRLALALGEPVTGKERDAAYALYLESKSIED